MTPKRSLLFIWILFCSCAFAQQTKLSFNLCKLSKSRIHSSEKISVLIKGDPEKIHAAVLGCGGEFHYNIGTISSVSIPAGSLETLAAWNFVTRIEQGSIRLHPLNDTMVVLNRVDK